PLKKVDVGAAEHLRALPFRGYEATALLIDAWLVANGSGDRSQNRPRRGTGAPGFSGPRCTAESPAL
ncbi:MAG: hypothetical protein WCH79_20010, partial [Planctomycetia bacterium]